MHLRIRGKIVKKPGGNHYHHVNYQNLCPTHLRNPHEMKPWIMVLGGHPSKIAFFTHHQAYIHELRQNLPKTNNEFL